LNAVEIEQAITDLADQPFDRQEFPFAFLEAFGNKPTTIKKLRAGASNKSDLPGGVIQTNNIHILTCDPGQVTAALNALKNSPATTKSKAKFILATDGSELEAEHIASGDTVACAFKDCPDHFGFFLPLAGITTVRQITENAFDIRATSRLNRLYVALLQENPEWGTDARRHDMNHFMARLIFCFFAEDTNIFSGKGLFTETVTKMSAGEHAITHTVIETLFRAMNTKEEERGDLPRWAHPFPYVNGGLFSGNMDVPSFTKIARSYLLHVGGLDWTKINPDIFGSMIQAVAEDEERGELGMHYTSVPNILKVLNPLFLDDLRAKLAEAEDNRRTLLNLRKRMARIRVFDPACGSGNFLVIAYKAMREIEAEINRRRGEDGQRSEIPLTNFRGIELRDFPAEIARLALVIAEYQCDVLYRGEKLALAQFLPLRNENWITCGNALRLDWLSVCPPTGTGVKLHGDDLFSTPLDQPQIDFQNEGGETYICGNPPYKGRNKKSDLEKADTAFVFSAYQGSFASLDYVANWFLKAARYLASTRGALALVATNSVCQGEQVALLWPRVFELGLQIHFAHTSFKWSNLATKNAGVTVVVVGLTAQKGDHCTIFSDTEARKVASIGPYLVPNSLVFVAAQAKPLSNLGMMYLGNMPKDGGHLLFSKDDARRLISEHDVDPSLIRAFYGSEELIHAKPRACLWIEEHRLADAKRNSAVAAILGKVRAFRSSEDAAPSTQAHAATPHRFVQLSAKNGERAIIVPRVSSENRPYLPVDHFQSGPIIGDKCYALYDESLWHLALIASRMHLVWIGTVCSRLRTDFSYGNKLGWNTFPVPALTDKNKNDLTRCAEDILLAREHHFPATIADLYDPANMPKDLRQAHERNDEVLERIYIGRRFKNDTERLERLFDLYTKMIAAAAPAKAKKVKAEPKHVRDDARGDAAG
jgi:hypothetical protein